MRKIESLALCTSIGESYFYTEERRMILRHISAETQLKTAILCVCMPLVFKLCQVFRCQT